MEEKEKRYKEQQESERTAEQRRKEQVLKALKDDRERQKDKRWV